MEHNKRVLTSQEKTMEEYLRRQQKEAEKHIQRQAPMMTRRPGTNKHQLMMGKNQNMNQQFGRHGITSMPGTPTGSRRNEKSENYRYLEQNGPNGSRGMVQMTDPGLDGKRG